MRKEASISLPLGGRLGGNPAAIDRILCAREISSVNSDICTGRWLVMAKTLLDVDEELLVEATIALGTATKKDTVNSALRFAVEETRARRKRALASLQQIADGGGFDFDKLDELDQ